MARKVKGNWGRPVGILWGIRSFSQSSFTWGFSRVDAQRQTISFIISAPV